ncbi:MAG: protein kinase [Deltaproteobacteria bacterium]|nr:protein kinase [Deltaproteobacteria bacterium]
MRDLIGNVWNRLKGLAGAKSGADSRLSGKGSQKIPLNIGRYIVNKEIGRGGMGVVYLGQDPFIERLVAIKTSKTPPPSDFKGFEKFRRSFFHEARAAGSLEHPNIVSVHDAAVENDQCYLVMEYVDGTTLKDYCRKENLLSVSRVVKVIFQCAKALEYAHQEGVFHRDIKPANIMISKKGEVKITDFGIAAVSESADSGREDSMTASISYSSPEQLRQEPPGPQSDIFSLGVVAYELLTGIKPFFAETEITIFYKINNEEPEPVRKYRPDIPESLERIIFKALEKNPADRYQTAQQVTTELLSSFGHLRFLEEEINFEKKFNAVKNISFFKDFSSSELVEILKFTQWIKYDLAMRIISEGESEEFFYVIVAGEVLVKKRGQQIAVLKRGDCFGEMAYDGQMPRTATIQAVKDTIVMKIGASFIDQTSISTQLRFHKNFNQTLIKRLARTTNTYLKSAK